MPVEKKRDVAAKVPARKPQIVCGAATASPKSMKKPVDDAVPVRPPCVKRPGEECSCGDTGCDGPPVFVPSPESASVCSSYDVFCAKVPVSKSCVASSESCSAELFCC